MKHHLPDTSVQYSHRAAQTCGDRELAGRTEWDATPLSSGPMPKMRFKAPFSRTAPP